MITYTKALTIAEDHIKPREKALKEIEPDDGLVLSESVEFDQGWVFYFVSRKFLETRDNLDRLIGRGPVIVGKERGDVYQGGSGYTEDEWINQFKDYVQSK